MTSAKNGNDTIESQLGYQARWYTTDHAAEMLSMNANALRARLRRSLKKSEKNEKGEVIIQLGMGVIGRKLGDTWRVFVPPAGEV
jgi:hypothetical protein